MYIWKQYLIHFKMFEDTYVGIFIYKCNKYYENDKYEE